MSDQRIRPEVIQAIKNWMQVNASVIESQGINQIEGSYTDDGDYGMRVSQVSAYRKLGNDFRFVTYIPDQELVELLEELTTEDNFFQGSQGNGGDFRLLFGIHPQQPGNWVIEHSSYELITTRLDHEIEVY